MIKNLESFDFFVSASLLAKVTGKIVSFSASFGSVCRFMTRHMHLAICSRKSWDTFFHLSNEAIVEINFWKLNCMFLTILKEYVLPERIIYTSANDHAGAGYCLQILGKIVHRMWTKEDSRRSSTWRELKAMELTLDSFKVELEGKCVKVYTDNQNAARIIEVESMNKELHDIAFAIVKICILYRITFKCMLVTKK